MKHPDYWTKAKLGFNENLQNHYLLEQAHVIGNTMAVIFCTVIASSVICITINPHIRGTSYSRQN